MKTQSFIDTIDGAYLPIPDAPYSTNDLGFLSDVDLAGISNAVNLKLIGVIGKRYFLEHAIQIDYEHARFREVSKETLKSGDAGEKLEMTLDHDHFYTHIDVNGEQLDKVLIDTGSTGLLTLDDKTAADLGFTSGKGQPISGGTVYGKIAGVGYRPDSIDIHGMKFDHPGIAIFPLKAGVGPKSLGNEFFSHYTVTIDGAGNAMYLKPLEKGKDSTTQPVAK